MQYLYLIKCQQFYKIGIAGDVQSRLAQLSTGNPFELEVLAVYGFANAQIVEAALHQKFASKRERGEWFELSIPDAEAFREICELLGGQPDVAGEDATVDEADIEEAEVLAEPAEGVTKWDYAAMFADGWCMEPYGNGREGGRGKYWGWRKRKDGERGYIYGGLISQLPYPISDMRLIYRDGEQPFNPPNKVLAPSESVGNEQ